MKLQLDTVNKTIKVENNVVFKELVDTLERILPKGEWKSFTLETSTTIHNWNSPYVIERTREVPVYPRTPWPWYLGYDRENLLDRTHNLGSQKIEYQLKSGVFNVMA